MIDYYASCAVIGHTSLSIGTDREKLLKITCDQIRLLIYGKHVGYFYFGGPSEFNNICLEAIKMLKKQDPSIKYLVHAIYIVHREDYLYGRKKIRYTPYQDYDDLQYFPLEFTGWRLALYYRNCAMIDRSDYVLCNVFRDENSGAYKAIKYAKRKKKDIINMVFCHL